MLVRVVALVLFVAAAAGAQRYTDSFNYPSGTTVPNYSTEFGGNWSVTTGQAAESDITVGWHYLVHDTIRDRDCCVEDTVYYAYPLNIEFGGPCARTIVDQGGTRLTTYLAKAQDNWPGGSGAFNRVFLMFYQSPLGFVGLSTLDITPSPIVRTRLIVTDGPWPNVTILGYFDTNMDGVWDARLTGVNVNLWGVAGGVGLSAFARTYQDDFRYFDAVLWESTGGPGPGSSVFLNARSVPLAGYVAASSLSNAGFALGGVTVPLSPDPLMLASQALPAVFKNFSGLLDETGSAQLEIVVPQDNRLIGTVVYTAFASFDPQGKLLEVSNDAQFRIGG